MRRSSDPFSIALLCLSSPARLTRVSVAYLAETFAGGYQSLRSAADTSRARLRAVLTSEAVTTATPSGRRPSGSWRPNTRASLSRVRSAAASTPAGGGWRDHDCVGRQAHDCPRLQFERRESLSAQRDQAALERSCGDIAEVDLVAARS